MNTVHNLTGLAPGFLHTLDGPHVLPVERYQEEVLAANYSARLWNDLTRGSHPPKGMIPLMAGLVGTLAFLYPGIAEAANTSTAVSHDGVLGICLFLLAGIFGRNQKDPVWGEEIPSEGALERGGWTITRQKLTFEGRESFEIYSQGFTLGNPCNTVVQYYFDVANRWENLSSLMIDPNFRYMASPGYYLFQRVEHDFYVKLTKKGNREFEFSHVSFKDPFPTAVAEVPILPRPSPPIRLPRQPDQGPQTGPQANPTRQPPPKRQPRTSTHFDIPTNEAIVFGNWTFRSEAIFYAGAISLELFREYFGNAWFCHCPRDENI